MFGLVGMTFPIGRFWGLNAQRRLRGSVALPTGLFSSSLHLAVAGPLEKIAGETVGAAVANNPRQRPKRADVSDVLHQAGSRKIQGYLTLVSPRADQDVDFRQSLAGGRAAMFDDRSVGEEAFCGLVREDERQGAPHPIAVKAVPAVGRLG